MALIELYVHGQCHLCADALAALERVRLRRPFELRQIDIAGEETLLRAYFERVPVVCLDGEELFELFVDERQLYERLCAGG